MNDTLLITLQLLLAIFLGGLIGVERETLGKPAGSRTYALIALGSALFTILSVKGFCQYPNAVPTALVSQIIIGIGFIGAGLIIFHRQHIEGITTASGLWATAAVGIAIGIGWYYVAIITSVMIFLLLYIVRKVEFERHKKKTLWSLFEKK
ncbi:MAG: MgtC/SapB family protein [Patescibacteria group bacterium]|nr:MgtC/SapB family protein [Patescibacteria group bacterium]